MYVRAQPLVYAACSPIDSLKSKKPELFGSPQIFHRVMYLLEGHTIRLAVRQRLFLIFDKDLMRRIVLEEASEDEDEAESQPTTARPLVFPQ